MKSMFGRQKLCSGSCVRSMLDSGLLKTKEGYQKNNLQTNFLAKEMRQSNISVKIYAPDYTRHEF